MTFKHFYNQNRNSPSILNESWWRKPKTEIKEIAAQGKNYRYWKMESDNGPAWILQSRNGARYGLFRANENKFHIVRMKKGKKFFVNPRMGYFTEENDELKWIGEEKHSFKNTSKFGNSEEYWDEWQREIHKGIYTEELLLINEGVFNKIKDFAKKLGLLGIIGLGSVGAMSATPELHNTDTTDSSRLEVSDQELSRSQGVRDILSKLVTGQLSLEQANQIADNVSGDNDELSSRMKRLFKFAYEQRGTTLNEGGEAAKSLIDQKLKKLNPELNLEYSKISQSDLPYVFDEVLSEILNHLKSQEIIPMDYKPSYSLGSTRLAADIQGKPVKKSKWETPEVVSKAKQQKQNFGDLDIDIEIVEGKTLRDAQTSLEQLDASKYAFRFAGKEINSAVRLDDGRVIQIDIVDVTGRRSELEFGQSSGMQDIAVGVKGVIHKVLIASIVQSHEPSIEDREKVSEVAISNPEIQKWLSKGYEMANTGRFLLGDKGIRLVVDLTKEGVKTRKTIDIEDVERYSIEDMDTLAQVILGSDTADADDLGDAVRMAEVVSENKDLAQKVWEKFTEKMELAKERMDENDWEIAYNEIKKRLGV